MERMHIRGAVKRTTDSVDGSIAEGSAVAAPPVWNKHEFKVPPLQKCGATTKPSDNFHEMKKRV